MPQAGPGESYMIRLLLVESDVDKRGLAKQLLEKADSALKVETASGVIEALTRMARENFDCLLVGHSPILNSLEVTSALKSVSSSPVIIYAWESGENLASKAFDARAEEYLLWERFPEESTIFAKRIRLVVERRWAEELRRAVVEVGGNAVAVESEGELVYVNVAFEDITGASSSDLQGKGLTTLVLEADRKDFQGSLKRGGETSFTILRGDGSTRRCKAVVRLTRLLGREASVITIKEVSGAINREARLRTLHRHAPGILHARNLDSLTKATLSAVEAAFDADIISFMVLEGEELVCLDRRWRSRSIRLPMDGEGTIARSAREGKPVKVRDFTKETVKVEEFTPLSELSVPIKSDEKVVALIDVRNGKPEAFNDDDVEALEILSLYIGCALNLIRDMESYTSSEAQYRHLLEALNDAVFVIDDSRYVYVNKSGAQLLGYDDPAGLIGADAFEKVAPEYRELIRGRVKARLRGEETPDEYELRLIRRDGSTIDVEVRASKIIFEGKPASLAINKDVTNQKRMQNQIKKYTEELEQQVEKRTQELLEAQQLAAAGRMASMVGHDLRSPLQSIRNAAYLLRRQPARSEEMLNSIEASVDRALVMLEELRHRTRETPLKIEAIDLPELISDIIKDVAVMDPIKVEPLLDPELRVVEVDPLKVRRVLDNLIRNAIEAMPEGGKLTVETKGYGDHFTIKIADTGVGISKEQLPNLFKPFYTTKSKGLGLGLAYSLKAVEAHGGTIEVESKVGSGTTFKITMPVRPAQQTTGVTA